jgi:cell division protein ZapA
MSRKIKTINVTIMEKDYPVACPPGQEGTLMAAVDQVDRLMHTIKRNGRTVGVERIAVMAAINMAHELLMLKEKGAKGNKTTHKVQGKNPPNQGHGKQRQTNAQPETETNIETNNTLSHTMQDVEPNQNEKQLETAQKIAQEEAAIAAQLQALTHKLESALAHTEESHMDTDAHQSTTEKQIETDNTKTAVEANSISDSPDQPSTLNKMPSDTDSDSETETKSECNTEPAPAEKTTFTTS